MPAIATHWTPARLARLTVIAALVGHASWCVAGRPMATEDAGVLASGDCELETYTGHNSTRHLPSGSTASLQLGCGVGAGTQAALAFASFGSHQDPGHALTLAGKTQLNSPDDKQTAYTLAWGLVGLQGHDQSLRHDVTYLTAVATHPLTDDLNLHANLGWQRQKSLQKTIWTWSVGLEQAVTERVDLTGETYASNCDHAAWLQVGLRFAAVPDKLYLDTSLARQTGASHSSVVTAGLRLAF